MVPDSTPTVLPFRLAAVGFRPEPFLVIRLVGSLYISEVKSICCERSGVTVIEDRIASNLRACNAGIIPSKLCDTNTHLTFSSAQIARPRSISKPTNLPLGERLSKGG